MLQWLLRKEPTMGCRKKTFLPFAEAKALLKARKVPTKRAYLNWPDRPAGLPGAPWFVYATDWKGWVDFLGNDWLPFDEARRLAMAAGIKTIAEWKVWDRPSGIPTDPASVYQEWQCWGHFLGTGRLKLGSTPFMSFADAKLCVRADNVRTKRDFYYRFSRPEMMPSHPDEYYESEWQGWRDFLGPLDVAA
jgi:hypothetical protein